MMKYSLILLLFLVYSCRPCNDKTMKRLYFSETFMEYTDMFVPGNWWVYTNSDGTKSDSMYVTNWKDSVFYNKTNLCRAEPIVTFNLNSCYLLDTICDNYAFLSSLNSTNQSGTEGINIWNIYSSAGGGMVMRSGKVMESSKVDFNINNILIEGVYTETSKKETIVWGKKIGILFYTHNSDTFFLKNYFLK